MGIVKIHQLRVPVAVGVLSAEKKATQEILIDVEYSVDIFKAAKSDALSDTLDYAAVRDSIIKFARQHRFSLMESLAQHIVTQLQQQFIFKYLCLTLTKPNIFKDAQGVSLTIKDD